MSDKIKENIFYNLAIAAIMFLLAAAADIAVRLLIDVPLPKLGLHWFVLFLFFYCLSFTSKPVAGSGFFFVWLVETIGLCHWYYFGRIISARDIVGFAKAHNSVLKWTYIMDIWPAITVMLAVLAAGITFFIFLTKHKATRNLYLLVCVMITLYIPAYSAVITVRKEWQPNNTIPIISNVIYAVSYFIFYSDKDIAIIKDDYLPYQITDTDTQVKKVLFILTDSWSLHHLKEKGYSRETMPLLSARLQSGKGYNMHTAIAPSVDTLISVPAIFNAVREPFNQKESLKKASNLFRIAKKKGYKTHCFTAHAGFVFNESGKEYIDNFVSDLTDEEEILSYLKKTDLKSDSKEFIVLHYFSAHSPYVNNYAKHKKDFEKFKPINPLDRVSYTINSYDNSLLYMDNMIDAAINYFDEQAGTENSAVFLTADHAELLNYNNLWGHGILVTEGAKVPLIIRSAYNDLQKDWIPHWLLANNIAKHLGAKIINPNLQEDDFFIVDDYHFIKYRLDGNKIVELEKK